MPSVIWTSEPPLIMQRASAGERARAIGPAPAEVESAVRCPMPADVLTARVRAVTDARADTRRGRIRCAPGARRPLDDCGCMQGPPAPRQPPVADCTLSITLCRRGGGRALEETDRGFLASRGMDRADAWTSRGMDRADAWTSRGHG